MAGKKNTSYPKEKIKILLLENISEAAADIFKTVSYTHLTLPTKA